MRGLPVETGHCDGLLLAAASEDRRVRILEEPSLVGYRGY